MKKALVMAVALMFPLAALTPAQAQEAAKKAPPAKAAPAKAAPAKADATKKADPAKKVEKKAEGEAAAPAADKKAAMKAAKDAAKGKATDKAKGIPEMCPKCRAKLEYHTVARDAFKAMADSFKGDPVPKQLKGPAKKAYMNHVKMKKGFYTAMFKAHDKMVKEITKAHKGKGPTMCAAMKEAPEEVKKALEERAAAHAAEMKKIDDAKAAMKAAKEAEE